MWMPCNTLQPAKQKNRVCKDFKFFGHAWHVVICRQQKQCLLAASVSNIHEALRHFCHCIHPMSSKRFKSRSTSKKVHFFEGKPDCGTCHCLSLGHFSGRFSTSKPPGGQMLNTEAGQPLWPGERHRRGRKHLLDAGAAAQSGTAQLHHPRHDVPDGEG